MKVYGGSGCIDPHFLDLGTSWKWVVSFTPGERAPGTHYIGGCVGPRAGLDDVEKKKFLALPGLEPHPSVVQPVTSRYTDYAIPAPFYKSRGTNYTYSTSIYFNS
jgi:hypothetical protein